ncbi:MAG: septum formation protein Maf [Bacteroidetes bacterium]|jgi:septum formation protein|nr:septum formation protein Maf [Bacteroidota bacterium]
MKEKLILASKSPRRKQILTLADIEFEIIAEDTPESYPEDLAINQIPIHIALQKALQIKKDYPDRKILAADTIVVLGDEIIGKPKDKADAMMLLGKLSGQTHQVITGVVILQGDEVLSFADLTTVTFNTLTPAQIEYYVDQCKPYDKAGAYAIQEWIGAVAIQKIEGCFYNVMGLPISRIIPYL